MNAKNSIMTFALVGLAAGTVTWLLLGTKEGRKQLDHCAEGLRQFTGSVKDNAKKGLDRAAEMANKASREVDEMRAKATNQGKAMMDQADEAAKRAVNRAQDTIKTAKQKTHLS